MSRLSKQEIVLGFLSMIIFIFTLGWYGLLLASITSILWVCGGSYSKGIRRIGVPLAVFIFTHSFLAFLAFPILCLGDGYPDQRTGDTGSWLGRFIEDMFFENSDVSIENRGLFTKTVPVVLLQFVWIGILISK